MQKKPAGWPVSAPVETVPDVQVSMDGGVWPPAAGTSPAGTASVLDWDVKRDLTGGALPGQALSGSGFSVATGTVNIPQPAGAPLTPWASAGRRVAPGGLAWLTASHSTVSSLRLGRFIVDSINGAALDDAVSLDLVESQRRMDGLFTYDWAYNAARPVIDASAALRAAARAGGYRTEADEASQYGLFNEVGNIRVPFLGSIDPISGHVVSTTSGLVSRTSGGRAGFAGGGVSLVGPGAVAYPYYYRFGLTIDGLKEVSITFPTTRSSTVRCELSATGFKLYTDATPSRKPDEKLVATAPWPDGGFTPGVPTRVYLWMTFSQNDATGTELKAVPSIYKNGSLINGDDVFATNPTMDGYPVRGGIEDPNPEVITIGGPGQGWFTDFVLTGDLSITDPSAMTDALGAAPTLTPNAFIEHASSPLSGVFDVKNKKARDVFQDIARATMGAGWQSETGDLIYRSRESLRTGAAVERVEAETSLVDVPWTIRQDEVADRIEVTYTPAAVVRDSTHKLTLWEATEPIQIGSNRSVTIYADITGTTDRISPFSIMNASKTDPANLAYSRWLAAPTPSGGGARPADEAIRIETKIVSPSKVRLNITNTTNGTLWLVDGDGNPTLILRSSLQVQPGEQQSVEWGAAEDRAIQPFTFDAGQWVQDRATALELLDWLNSQMAKPLPSIPSVSVKPDLARQLGDVIVLTEAKQDTLPGDPEHIPLKTKALITGISLSGDAGGYDQALSLALLGVTFGDFDRWGTNLYPGAKTFAAFDAWLVSQGILTAAQLDAYFERALVDA